MVKSFWPLHFNNDNIFVERLWRSVKYERVYLTAFEYDHHLKQALCRYFRHYGRTRYHQSLDYHTPNQVHYQQLTTLATWAENTAVSELSRAFKLSN